MNYKILGLLAFVLTALVVLPAVAQATTVTSPTGTATTANKHGVNKEGHIKLTNPISNIECSSTLEGPIESHGSGVTAVGPVTTLDFTGCTNSWHVTASKGGTLIAHHTSGYNASVTSTGAKIVSTRAGVTCTYETNNTTMGTAVGGNPAILEIAASIPINTSESSGLCGTSAATMSGKYEGTGSAYYDA